MEDKEKRKKDSNSSKSDRVTLKKEIGLLSACAIIIGNIIGSGIFISPKGVLEHAGSVGLSLIVWVCGGGICTLGSMCYAELGVTIPKSGGDYSYVTEIFGGLIGFLLLWSAVLIMYPTTLAVIALTFSNYVLQPAFPNCLPPYIATRLLATICILVTVTLLSPSTMETGNGQDTLHINDGGSHWPADILVGCLMFLLAAWHHPIPPPPVHSITLQTSSHTEIIVILSVISSYTYKLQAICLRLISDM